MSVDVVGLASEFPNDNPALHRGVIWVCLEPTGPLEPERAAAPLLQQEPPANEAVLAADAGAEDEEPAADAEEDEEALTIVVEELEPIEARTEGDAVEDELITRVPVPTLSEVVLVAGGREDRDVPAEADAVVVEDDALVTPAFEEIAANDYVPRDSTALPPAPDDPFTVLVCMLTDVAIGAGSPLIASLLPGLFFDGRVPEPLDEGVQEALRGAGLWDGTQVSPSFVATTCAWRAILRGTSDDFSACGAPMLDEWASDVLAKLLSAPAKAPTLRQELRSRGVAAFGLVEAAA